MYGILGAPVCLVDGRFYLSLFYKILCYHVCNLHRVCIFMSSQVTQGFRNCHQNRCITMQSFQLPIKIHVITVTSALLCSLFEQVQKTIYFVYCFKNSCIYSRGFVLYLYNVVAPVLSYIIIKLTSYGETLQTSNGEYDLLLLIMKDHSRYQYQI